MTPEELYSMGIELDVEDLKKLASYFTLTCVKCKSTKIQVMTEIEDDGYCETCSNPYARATIKCTECGNAISIR